MTYQIDRKGERFVLFLSREMAGSTYSLWKGFHPAQLRGGHYDFAATATEIEDQFLAQCGALSDDEQCVVRDALMRVFAGGMSLTLPGSSDNDTNLPKPTDKSREAAITEYAAFANVRPENVLDGDNPFGSALTKN